MIDGLPNLTDLPWLNLGGSPTDVQLEGIGVTNLRSLVMAEPIPLRRLVLLVGANGVGKSTFARIFPLLRQSMGTRSRDPILWWDRDGVDFGSFAEAVRKGEEEIRLEFAFRHRSGDRFRSAASLRGNLQTTEVVEWESRSGQFLSLFRVGAGGLISDFQWTVNGAPIRLELKPGPLVPVHQESRLFGFHEPIDAAENDRVSRRTAERMLVAEHFFHHIQEQKDRGREVTLEEAVAELTGSISHLLHSIYFTIHRHIYVEALLTELALDTAYLGPARALPQRLYRSQSLSIETLDSRGDNLPMFLLALTPAETADLNEFLGAHLEFTIRMEPDGSQHSVQLCRRGVWHNLVDVGFGYSQLLPAAVQIWAASRVLTFQRRKSPLKAVVIEQPELHLHPHHQALLGRALCAAGATPIGPFQIIETHSAALIEEVGLEIARGHIPADQVVVCCFEADEATGATHVRLAEYDAEGVLHGWPAGFLSP